jgi:hypothetical protein
VVLESALRIIRFAPADAMMGRYFPLQARIEATSSEISCDMTVELSRLRATITSVATLFVAIVAAGFERHAATIAGGEAGSHEGRINFSRDMKEMPPFWRTPPWQPTQF